MISFSLVNTQTIVYWIKDKLRKHRVSLHPSQSISSLLWNIALSWNVKCYTTFLILSVLPSSTKSLGNIGIIPAIVHKIVFPSCNGIPVKWVLGAVVDSWELLITINMFKIWKIRTAVEWFSASSVTKVRYFCTGKYLLSFYLGFMLKKELFSVEWLFDWLIEVYLGNFLILFSLYIKTIWGFFMYNIDCVYGSWTIVCLQHHTFCQKYYIVSGIHDYFSSQYILIRFHISCSEIRIYS